MMALRRERRREADKTAEGDEEGGGEPSAFAFLHAGVRNLAGHTRVALTIADWVKSRGVKVVFIDKSDRPYVRFIPTAFPEIQLKVTQKVNPGKFRIRDINKYYYLPHLKPSDFTMRVIPSSYQGEEEIDMPPDVVEKLNAGFFTDIEVYSHLRAPLRQVGRLFVNYPTKDMHPLPGWFRVLTNSNFTRTRILQKWGKEWDPIVLYPPVYNVYDPNRTKDIDWIFYSRFNPGKFKFLKDFLKSRPSHETFVAVGQAEGYEQELKRMGVEIHANASFEQVKSLLERAKGYVHFMTFEDDGQVFGEHFGQSIVEALYAGATPWVPNVPSGALEIPGVHPYLSVEQIKKKAVDDKFIAMATEKFDPRARGSEVLEKLAL